MTLKELRTLISLQIQKPLMEVPFTSDLIDTMVNRGQYFVVEQTYCLYSKFVHLLAADQQFYNLLNVGGTGKNKALRTLNILVKNSSGKYTSLDPLSEYELDQDYSGWRTDSSGTPQYGAMDGHWLTITPPSSVDVVDGIMILVVRRPDDLVNEGDSCQILDEYQRYIVSYATSFLMGKMGEIEQLKQILKRERAVNIMRLERRLGIKLNAIQDYRN